jgi:hypothetical protein
MIPFYQAFAIFVGYIVTLVTWLQLSSPRSPKFLAAASEVTGRAWGNRIAACLQPFEKTCDNQETIGDEVLIQTGFYSLRCALFFF